uniref:Uncharacterized protein n=1 Tax=Ditylenchus dipsaci TaxID=166011 RepID=A0A915ESZ0_9BILA
MDNSAFDFSFSYDDQDFNNVGDNQVDRSAREEENGHPDITSSKGSRRRGVRANLSSGAPRIQMEKNSDLSGRQYDQLDWFMNEKDFVLAKHQKEKLVDTAAENLISNDSIRSVAQSKMLKYPPMNGIEWFGVSSSDGNSRAYMTIRARNKSAESIYKFRTTKFVDRVEPARKKRQLDEEEHKCHHHHSGSRSNWQSSASQSGQKSQGYTPSESCKKKRRDLDEFADDDKPSWLDSDAPIKLSSSVAGQNKPPFSFKFNQGSSVAIRRNIRMDTLFYK